VFSRGLLPAGPSREFRAQQGENTNPPKSLSYMYTCTSTVSQPSGRTYISRRVAIWACGPCGPGGPHGYLGGAGKWSTYGPHGPHTTF
jgi:hypothetical protein